MSYEITLPNLYPIQKEIAQDTTRFKVIAAGRRAGKTRMCAVIAIKYALEGKKVMWCGPVLTQARVGWAELKKLAQQIPNTKIKEAEKTIELFSGGIISVRSADNPDSLRGQGLDLVICDEFAFYKISVWEEAIRPTLSDKQGHAIFISTPKGRNSFFRLFQKGNGDNDEWKSWHFSSNLNPYFPEEEWEIAKNELPVDVFRQEYEAQFLEDNAGVFRNINACIKPITNKNYRNYVMGVDLAKTHDFTVITLMDRQTAEVINTQRFNRLDWTYQKQKIIDTAKKYSAQVCVDSTGVGDPIYEDLKRSGINVKGFKFTNESKKDLINDLQVAFESEAITISPTEKKLIEELKIYEYQMTSTGKITYNAPAGGHDDCVISLALAYHISNKSLKGSKSYVFLAR